MILAEIERRHRDEGAPDVSALAMTLQPHGAQPLTAGAPYVLIRTGRGPLAWRKVYWTGAGNAQSAFVMDSGRRRFLDSDIWPDARPLWADRHAHLADVAWGLAGHNGKAGR
jgi:hypothetical protein